jgi:hypothetical protein
MNPVPRSQTPIYDALYVQWRADFRTVPGERGPEDLWCMPDFRVRTPPPCTSLEQSRLGTVPRQLPRPAAFSAVAALAPSTAAPRRF